MLVPNLQYQLKNSEACILNLICCNLSAVVPAPPLGGAAVKEGKPFPAWSNVQVAEPRNSIP